MRSHPADEYLEWFVPRVYTVGEVQHKFLDDRKIIAMKDGYETHIERVARHSYAAISDVVRRCADYT